MQPIDRHRPSRPAVRAARPVLLAVLLAIGFAAALAVTTACGSLGGIDIGDILGSSGPSDSSAIEGTVTRVDTANRQIDLDVHQVNNLRESHPDSSIYYDADTVVRYQGATYEPTDLENGDQISATGTNVGGRYVADQIDVVRNVRR